MDHSVVTIFCCGTDEQRDQFVSNIVPYTWRITAGQRVWMNDGPGNAKYAIGMSERIMKQVERKKTKNVIKKIGRGISDGVGIQMHGGLMDGKRSTGMGRIGGLLGGTGSQDNIINTLQWLWMEHYSPNKPTITAINLCGWSRGAVTCIMLAHAIEEAGFRNVLPNLKVNIFAIDPVPGGMNDFGGGDFDKTGRAGSPHDLSPCVNEYQAVLAENVGGAKGTVFRNCSPKYKGSNVDGPKKTEYPFPGTHSDVAKFTNEVGKLTVSLCHRFLAKHGTELMMPKTLAATEELEQYARILMDRGEFKKKHFWSRSKKFQKWDTALMRKSIVKNSERSHRFFVNHHHAKLLETLTPRVAAYIAEEGPLQDSELQTLQARFPNTYAAMQVVGYIQ